MLVISSITTCPGKHIGKNRKWALDNRGPFRVQRRLNDVNYVIQKSPASTPIVVHIDRLTKHHLVGTGIPKVWRNYKGSKQAVTTSSGLATEEPVTPMNVDDGLATDEVQALNPNVQPFVPRAALPLSSDRQAPMASSLPMPNFDRDPMDVDSSPSTTALQLQACRL